MSLKRATGSLTKQEFNKAIASFPKLSEKGKSVGFAVLVEGLYQADAAEKFDVALQQVYSLVKRIYGAHLTNQGVPKGWLSQTITLPPDKMQIVKKMEQEALLEAATEKRKKVGRKLRHK